MKIEQTWIISADEALKSEYIGIVKRLDTGEFYYPSVYKGYLSSFGASIVQSGLVPASAFFEKADSNTEGNRYNVIKAVIYILQRQEKLPDNIALLSTYSLQNEVSLKHIDKAIAALKIAIRQYKEIKTKNENKENPNKTETNKWANASPLSKNEFSEQYECNKDNTCSNIGWLYCRDYYRKFTNIPTNILVKNSDRNNKEKIIEKGTDMELIYKKQNEYICRSLFPSLGKYNKMLLESLPCNTKIHFKTTYPGLLVGSGLSHGTGTDNDMKIGFQFDYTTGLPYIPGSSIKGVLRSMFPLTKKDLNKDEQLYNKKRIEYIRTKIGNSYTDDQIIMLAKAIFGDSSNDIVGKRDIFMDAIITQGNEKGFFMGDDFITKHENPLKNPTPLQFLKVLPEVTFCFLFNLYNSDIGDKVFDKELKRMLFQEILEDVGVGAKTNVGYGQLIFVNFSKK